MTEQLRQATLADLDAVMELENAGFEAGIVEARQVFAQRIRQFPEGFLLSGDPAWGYLCAELWDDVELESEQGSRSRFDLGHPMEDYHRADGSVLYVASMTVTPSLRREGRGRRLFQNAVNLLLNAFPAVERVVLIVNEHWTSAIRIYEGEGFVHQGTLEKFFHPATGPTVDAWILHKQVYKKADALHR